jgi:hypothetical protein
MDGPPPLPLSVAKGCGQGFGRERTERQLVRSRPDSVFALIPLREVELLVSVLKEKLGLDLLFIAG